MRTRNDGWVAAVALPSDPLFQGHQQMPRPLMLWAVHKNAATQGRRLIKRSTSPAMNCPRHGLLDGNDFGLTRAHLRILNHFMHQGHDQPYQDGSV